MLKKQKKKPTTTVIAYTWGRQKKILKSVRMDTQQNPKEGIFEHLAVSIFTITTCTPQLLV